MPSYRIASFVWLLVSIFASATTSPGVAQTAKDSSSKSSPNPPAFEVASIRIVSPEQHGFTSISPPGSGHFTANNISLKLLIAYAYGIDDRNIAQFPHALDQTLYEVKAKPEGDAAYSYEQLKPMVQQLLKNRFQLATHYSTREESGFALVETKSGPKLKPSQGPSGPSYITPNEIVCSNWSIGQFASTLLSRSVGSPVADKTGIKGKYDIVLHFAPMDSTDSPLPSIFTAVQEQLGLKLKPEKISTQILVIDHVNREPTEN